MLLCTFKDITNPTYAQLINYEDVLNHKEVAKDKDPVISDVQLTKDTSYPVRLVLKGTHQAKLYIDKNADGIWNTGERL